MGQVTAVSPLTEKEFTYVRSVRELGAGNGPLSPFRRFEPSPIALPAEGTQLLALAARMSRLSLTRI